MCYIPSSREEIVKMNTVSFYGLVDGAYGNHQIKIPTVPLTQAKCYASSRFKIPTNSIFFFDDKGSMLCKTLNRDAFIAVFNKRNDAAYNEMVTNGLGMRRSRPSSRTPEPASSRGSVPTPEHSFMFLD